MEETFENDPIQQGVGDILTAIKGFPGDLVVFLLLGLVLWSLFRRKYKPAAGFFILTIGVVLIRILIYNLF